MAGPTYIADGPGAVDRVELDGLAVLFHAPSGMTHIVAPPAPQILDALRAGPADAADILKRLRARFDFEDGKAIHARLDELEAAGLVRSA